MFYNDEVEEVASDVEAAVQEVAAQGQPPVDNDHIVEGSERFSEPTPETPVAEPEPETAE